MPDRTIAIPVSEYRELLYLSGRTSKYNYDNCEEARSSECSFNKFDCTSCRRNTHLPYVQVSVRGPIGSGKTTATALLFTLLTQAGHDVSVFTNAQTRSSADRLKSMLPLLSLEKLGTMKIDLVDCGDF